MKNIKLLATGSYLPSQVVENSFLEKKYGIEPGYIEKRTGIQKRFQVNEEKIEDLAILAVENLKQKNKINMEEIDAIIVGTTTSDNWMPGISFLIQKHFHIPNCFCLDVLGGCNSYINAWDIARNYIALGKIKKALIVGVELLSSYIQEEDIGTAILFSDGAGATIIEATEEEKKYASYLVSDGENGDILTCRANQKIFMNGKEIYKYAVKESVKCIEKLLEEENMTKQEITYLIPHQSNQKIIESITSRLGLSKEKVYSHIEKIGNTFSASIPIALNEMKEKNLLHTGDKVLLLGYGGGLNTGCILIEI